MPCHPATYIAGTVTDGVSHQPIADAAVRLYFHEVRTAHSGCFALGGADGLPFEFSVSATGYKSIVVKAIPGSFWATVTLVPESSAGASSWEPHELSQSRYAESSKSCR